MEEGGGGVAVVPEGFAGGGEGGRVGGRGWGAGPVEELAVCGVAKVIAKGGAKVGVWLVEGEGADDDGEGLQRFGSVSRAAFAGDDAFDVGLDGEGDGEDELTASGGDGEGVAKGECFLMGGEGDGAGDGYGGDGGAVGEDEQGVGGADGDWGLGSGVWGLGDASQGDLFVVPEGPEADAEGGWGLGSGGWGLGC